MDELENPYVKVLSRKSRVKLVIAFSSAANKGGFNYYKLMKSIDASVILVNCPEESYYHFGLPSLGGVVESCSYLKRICDSILDHDGQVMTFGCSKGGYGALLFGSILKVNKILAFSPTCPEYTPREVVQNNLQKHIAQYEHVKGYIFQSESQKVLIYGGIAPQDYASVLEFGTLLNSNSTVVDGASHQIIQPLLHRYSFNELLDLSIEDFNESSVDLLSVDCVEYYKAAVQYRYRKSETSASDLLFVTRKHKEKIISDNFYSVFFALLLQERYRENPLVKQIAIEALGLTRPVSLLSLRLLSSSLSQHTESFVLKYCSHALGCANDKGLISPEDREKMIDAIIYIARSLVDKTAVEGFFKVVRNVTGRQVSINKLAGITSKNVFSNINLVENMEVADVLRETAFAFKAVGDVSTALLIMEKALEQRPDGPVIRKTLEQYRKELDAI